MRGACHGHGLPAKNFLRLKIQESTLLSGCALKPLAYKSLCKAHTIEGMGAALACWFEARRPHSWVDSFKYTLIAHKKAAVVSGLSHAHICLATVFF